MRRRVFIVFFIALVLLGGFAVIKRGVVFQQNIPPAERGRRIAEREGCFTCHGPSGFGGIPNAGSRDATVPDLRDDVPKHAKTINDIRAWIQNGRLDDDADPSGVLRMPAFGERLASGEIEDLVAFVMTLSRMDPPLDGAARRGMKRAEELGCFGCHGAGGRFAVPNPGSLKGYIPSWDGDDFPDMVRDKTEFTEWVEDGVCERFGGSPFARVYLERAVIKMPGFHEHLAAGDVDAIWAYIEWLRSNRP